MRQSEAGTVAFYSENGVFLYERRYNSVQRRADIIAFARKLYGKQFQNMFYHIVPVPTASAMERAEKLLAA